MKQIISEIHTHQLFENISTQYDLANNLISFYQHKKWRRQAISLLQLEQGSKVLDLCCGTGDWTILTATAVGELGVVYGMDFSEKMLAKASQKISDCSLHNIILCKGNVTGRLPFADNALDYATIGFGLRNVSDYKKVIQEVSRVLRPGGKLLCLDTSTPSCPMLKQLYFIYLRFFVPLLGLLLLGSYEEYLWLYKSTLAFPDKARLAEDFREAGFTAVKFDAYWGGTVAVHLGIKA